MDGERDPEKDLEKVLAEKKNEGGRKKDDDEERRILLARGARFNSLITATNSGR